jgi:serine/threonine protein kinase
MEALGVTSFSYEELLVWRQKVEMRIIMHIIPPNSASAPPTEIPNLGNITQKVVSSLGTGQTSKVGLLETEKGPVAYKRYNGYAGSQHEKSILSTLDCPTIIKPLAATENGVLLPLIRPFTDEMAGKPLCLNELLNLTCDLLLALYHLQRKHIYHRDIKPANIGLADGRHILIDFGEGKMVKRVSDINHTWRIFTANYQAPEV